jgi:hypothetical protein
LRLRAVQVFHGETMLVLIQNVIINSLAGILQRIAQLFTLLLADFEVVE